MRAGRIVDRGAVADILGAPVHEYTRGLIAATPRMDEAATPRMDETATPRMDETATPRSGATHEPTSSIAAEATLEARAVVVQHRLRAPRMLSKYWFSGRGAPQITAVDAVSLRVAAGEALGIVGESGCGKSSLARALLRLNDIASGEIVWLGEPIQGLAGAELREVRSGLQMVFQDPVASLDPLQSVADIVAEPLRALRPELGAAERAARVRAMLDSVGLGEEFSARRSGSLSGGQCQRVAIARAMVLEPKLLVCDEAVSSLDVSIQAQILDLLADIKRRGTGIVFVSHNLAVVRRLCERVVVMYLGRAVEAGPTDAVFAQPRHPYTRMLLDSVPLLDPALERRRLAALVASGGLARGEGPSAVDRPPGCAFHTRCPVALPACAMKNPEPEYVSEIHEVACLRWRDIVKSVPV